MAAPTKTSERLAARKANYTTVEINKLLDVIEEKKPIGAKQWDVVAHAYNAWALHAQVTTREAKSITFIKGEYFGSTKSAEVS